MTFVAQSVAEGTELIVAARGTNGVADLDWLMEDFDVRQMMPWPSAPRSPIRSAR